MTEKDEEHTSSPESHRTSHNRTILYLLIVAGIVTALTLLERWGWLADN